MALVALALTGAAQNVEPVPTPQEITEEEHQERLDAQAWVSSTWPEQALEIRHEREERRRTVENTLLAEASRRQDWHERREVAATRATERMARSDAVVCSSFALFIALGVVGWALHRVWTQRDE